MANDDGWWTYGDLQQSPKWAAQFGISVADFLKYKIVIDDSIGQEFPYTTKWGTFLKQIAKEPAHEVIGIEVPGADWWSPIEDVQVDPKTMQVFILIESNFVLARE